MKKLIFTLVAVLCATIGYSQANLTGALPATTLAGSSTNYAGPAFGALGVDQIAVFSITSVCTNSSSPSVTSNLAVYLDANLQGNGWQTNAYALYFTSATNTAYRTSFAKMTNTLGAVRFRASIANPNTNQVTVSDFYWRSKE
jgi:hypothetical protein